MTRQYYTTLLIWFSLLTSEVHTIWEGSKVNANWILTKNVPMNLQWNIKYLTDEIWFVLLAASIYYYVPNKINRTTAKAYFCFCVVDLCMYFYNFKQEGYDSIYTFLLIAWIIIYNYGGNNRKGVITTA
jgi:hypothetical protein